MSSKFLIWAVVGLLLASSAAAIIFQVPSSNGTVVSAPDQVQSNLAADSNVSSFTVFIPDSNANSDLQSLFQGSSGISIESYGYLTSVVFFPVERAFVLTQLSLLIHKDPGVYFVNGTSSPYTPFNYYSSASANTQYYTPQNIYAAYSFGGANSRGILGNGTTIAVVDAYGDPFIGYDVVAFDNQTGLPPIQLTIKYLNNTPNPYNQSWAIETALDVEWAHASAPGAKILLVITQNASTSLEDGLSYVINKNIANVISLSWGQAESDISSSDLRALSQLYRIAAENNISIFAASGDLGSGDGKSVPTVNYPASDPYVTGVGGTALNYNNGVYSETAWGGNSSDGKTFGSGGGYSAFFPQPSWQTIGNKSTGMRGVPDVAADASTYTEVLMIADGKTYSVGGTSLSTPIWAGIAARIDQSLGRTTGYLNPTLYQIYRSPYYSSSFTTITTGSNGYYSASAGWDPVTGLGTPRVSSLISDVDNLTQTYGSMAIQNGSYGFGSASAYLNISGKASLLDLNGSAFYYLSYYFSNQSYVRFGIVVNDTSVGSRLSIRNGSLSTILENYIGTPANKMYFQLGIGYNGSILTYSINGTSHYRNVLIPFAGESRFALGAEILNPVDNRTIIPTPYFSGIQLNSSNGSALQGNLWQNHYSGVSGQFNYSNISLNMTKSLILAQSGNYSPDGYLNDSYPDNVTIKYTTTYSNKVTVNLNLNQQVSGVSWYIDGNLQSASTVLAPGSHNVTAEVLGNKIASMLIVVPNLFRTNLTIMNPVPYYKPQMQYVLGDLVWNVGTLGNLSVYLPSGTNSFSMVASGYLTMSKNITAGVPLMLNLSARPSTISVFVFQGNSTVIVNGASIMGKLGTYVVTIEPQSTSITVGSPGFQTKNLSLSNPIPGMNYSFSVLLVPVNQSLTSLNGTLKDAIYGFGLPGVLVQLGNYTSGYSNSSGFYQLYAPQGIYAITYSAQYYNTSTITVNLSADMIRNVSLFPQSLNLSNTYQPNIGFFLPIGYFCIYVSWTTKSVEGIASYIVEFSTSPNMSGARSIQVSNANQYAIIFPVGPAVDYYIQVIAKLVSGQTVPGEIQDLKGTATMNLLINGAIYTAIGIYIFVAARILRRAFAKKKSY